LAIDNRGYLCYDALMLYVLHHPKGALVLSADDRDQVLRWSERQLGSRAGLVSVLESDPMDGDDSVEKDGTGIRAMTARGCRPLVGIMANIAQDVPVEHGSSKCHASPLPREVPKAARQSLH